MLLPVELQMGCAELNVLIQLCIPIFKDTVA